MAFTVHGVDPELDRRLDARARRDGISKNQLVKSLLARAMGLEPRPEQDDYREFVGLWSTEEREDFERRIADNDRVIEGEWK